MKFNRKLTLLLAAVLVFAMAVPGALAVKDTAVEAGKTATLTFTFADVYNVDGAFTISDPQNIVSSHSVNIADAGKTSATVSGDRLWASPGAEPVKTTVSVKVAVKIKSSAAAGSTCTVTFEGIYGDANQAPGNEHDVKQSATITVKAQSSSGSDAGDSGSSPAPSASVSPSPAPSTSVGNGVDYSKLQKQLTVAEGLYLNDYDDESRVALVNAIVAGQNALSSDDQDTVNTAAQELGSVMSALVKMDYSRLRAVLDKTDMLLVSEQTAVLWEMLSKAAAEASSLLDSGDQDAVSAAASRLAEIIAQLEKELEVITETNIVVQEVPVVTLPTSDFCNMSEHHLWPVLCVVSLVLNVGLIGLVVIYVAKKAKNRKDETPLVDYDIADDI